jgi:hypothetical protein
VRAATVSQIGAHGCDEVGGESVGSISLSSQAHTIFALPTSCAWFQLIVEPANTTHRPPSRLRAARFVYDVRHFYIFSALILVANSIVVCLAFSLSSIAISSDLD